MFPTCFTRVKLWWYRGGLTLLAGLSVAGLAGVRLCGRCAPQSGLQLCIQALHLSPLYPACTGRRALTHTHVKYSIISVGWIYLIAKSELCRYYKVQCLGSLFTAMFSIYSDINLFLDLNNERKKKKTKIYLGPFGRVPLLAAGAGTWLTRVRSWVTFTLGQVCGDPPASPEHHAHHGTRTAAFTALRTALSPWSWKIHLLHGFLIFGRLYWDCVMWKLQKQSLSLKNELICTFKVYGYIALC